MLERYPWGITICRREALARVPQADAIADVGFPLSRRERGPGGEARPRAIVAHHDDQLAFGCPRADVDAARRTALSTRGWRISRGTGTARAASVSSTRTSSRSANRTSSTAR